MLKQLKRNKGFTLIELLVVIAIIAILAVLIILNLSIARKKARDAQRKSDLSQIQIALENYADDNGVYPSGTSVSNCAATSTTCIFAKSGPLGSILTKHITDPLSGRTYTYAPSGSTNYTLCATVEISSNANSTNNRYCIKQ